LGYHRYWLAEHHNFPALASSAPEIMIGQVAAATKTLRVGAGGVMLPNHAPLKVAENFKLLEALFPGRIDLGLGRAPGTDGLTAMALRGSREAVTEDRFPGMLGDLLCFLGGAFPDRHPWRKVEAIPAGGGMPDLWMLGSSGSTASLAAQLGLGYAFAHHIHADPAVEACRIYREQYQGTALAPEPRVMLGVLAVAAGTDEEAAELARPVELVRLRLRQGRKAVYPSPEEARAFIPTAEEAAVLEENRRRMFVGSVERVKEGLLDLAARCGADELMVLTITHDHRDRVRSYEGLARAFGLQPRA
ncbi:MAG TPA: LLM class flavin-dependent oxidoreductase, partial [bacterium]|nr:LLM class flavin-dependent oxidoreductase [bacterium]